MFPEGIADETSFPYAQDITIHEKIQVHMSLQRELILRKR